MKNQEQKECINYINKILKSKTEKLSPQTREHLIIVRECLRKDKVGKDFIGALKSLSKYAGFLGVLAELIQQYLPEH